MEHRCLGPSRRASWALLTAALLVSCARRKDEVTAPEVAAAPVLAYQGAAGFGLTLFDDCHLSFDGEDSVRFSRPYAFDETHQVLWMAGKPWSARRDGGALRELDGGSHDLWEMLEDKGHWTPIPGTTVREIPARCRCAGPACQARAAAAAGANPRPAGNDVDAPTSAQPAPMPRMFDPVRCGGRIVLTFAPDWTEGEESVGDECVTRTLRPAGQDDDGGRARVTLDFCGEPAFTKLRDVRTRVDFGDRVLSCTLFRPGRKAGFSCVLDLRRRGVPQVHLVGDYLSPGHADELQRKLLLAEVIDVPANCLPLKMAQDRFARDTAIDGPLFRGTRPVPTSAPPDAPSRPAPPEELSPFRPPFEPWCLYEPVVAGPVGTRIRKSTADGDGYEVWRGDDRLAVGRPYPQDALPKPTGQRGFDWWGHRYKLDVAVTERDHRWTIRASVSHIDTLSTPQAIAFSSEPLDLANAHLLVETLANLVFVARPCVSTNRKVCGPCAKVNQTRATVLASGVGRP